MDEIFSDHFSIKFTLHAVLESNEMMKNEEKINRTKTLQFHRRNLLLKEENLFMW